MISKIMTGPGVVVIGGDAGQSIIPQATPLRRLHYFDGKFLRAPDLTLEQNALLAQVRMSNQAGGPGIVHGLGCSVQGGILGIGAGLAIDPQGRLLHLPDMAKMPIAPLIEAGVKRTQGSKPGQIGFGDCKDPGPDQGGPDTAGGYYLLVALHTEAFCGSEEVYGKLCEAACVSDSERPYITEGIVVQAIGLSLALATSGVALGPLHERSRVASAYFRERRDIWPSLISRTGLESDIWCMSAQLAGGQGVPLALIAYQGGVVRFLDNWIARRERMESPSRQYWAGRMAMRPWPVFMAEVLQFQCQLPAALSTGGGKGGDDDPCAPDRELVGKAADLIEVLSKQLGAAVPAGIEKGGKKAPEGIQVPGGVNVLLPALRDLATPLVAERSLIDGGIVELPSAGWLPVDPSNTRTVNQQVRALLGKGVDLRFCVVRPDYVPHALEEAQHMERISLLQGLDDPDRRPQVDILVPGGRIEERVQPAPGTGYVMSMDLAGKKQASKPEEKETGGVTPTVTMKRVGLTETVNRIMGVQGLPNRTHAVIGKPVAEADLAGAARDEVAADGEYALYFACQSPLGKAPGMIVQLQTGGDSPIKPIPGKSGIRMTVDEPQRPQPPMLAMWLEFRMDQDPYQIPDGGRVRLETRLVYLEIETGRNDPVEILDVHLYGRLRRTSRVVSGPVDSVFGEIDLDGSQFNPDEGQTPQSLKVGAKCRVDRDQDPRGRRRLVMALESVTVTMNDEEEFVDLWLERTWESAETSSYRSGMGIWGTSQMSKDVKRINLDLVAGTFKVDPEVAKPAHPMHGASVTALQRIASILKQSDFAHDASISLFPPQQSQPEELRIHAREDWVLFHRRRDRVCEGDRPAAQPLPERIYRVHWIAAPSDRDLEIIKQALRTDDGPVLERYEHAIIQLAEFAPGVQALRTSPDDLRDPWKLKVPATAEIRYGAIASQGDAYEEGPELALARLDNLIGILGQESPFTGTTPPENLATYPSALAGGSVDGVIALVTVLPICHEVYRADIPSQNFATFNKDLHANWQEQIKDYRVRKLGSTSFEDGTDTLVGDTAEKLKELWSSTGGGTPYHVTTILEHGAEGLSDDQPYEEQSKALFKATGSSGDIKPETIPAEQGPKDCGAATWLFVDPTAEVEAETTVDVRAVLGYTEESADTLGFNISKEMEENGTEGLSSAEVVVLTQVRFDVAQVPRTEDLELLKKVAIEAGLLSTDGAPLSSHHVGVQAVRAGKDESNRIDQARSIWNSLGLPEHEVNDLTTAASMPKGLNMVMVIVTQSQPATHIMTPIYVEAATTADDVVTNWKPAIHSNDAGGIAKNEAFDTTATRLKDEGILLDKVEIVSDDANAIPLNTKRGQALLTALREAGIADAETKMVVRKPTVKEQELMATGQTPREMGFVLRKRATG